MQLRVLYNQVVFRKAILSAFLLLCSFALHSTLTRSAKDNDFQLFSGSGSCIRLPGNFLLGNSSVAGTCICDLHTWSC